MNALFEKMIQALEQEVVALEMRTDLTPAEVARRDGAGDALRKFRQSRATGESRRREWSVTEQDCVVVQY